MKLNHLFFTLAALAFFSKAQAQVKVGANFATIGSNSALEVEATNGKKVVINKADGTTVIENIPVSTNASDKMLGVDATGKLVSLVNTAVPIAPYLRLDGSKSMNSNNPSTPMVATGLGVTLVNQMSYDASGNITFTSPGIYYLAASALPGVIQGAVTRNDVCLWIYRNGVNVDISCARSTQANATNLAGNTAAISGIYQINAGDQFSVRITSASDANVTNSYALSVSFYKMSN